VIGKDTHPHGLAGDTHNDAKGAGRQNYPAVKERQLTGVKGPMGTEQWMDLWRKLIGPGLEKFMSQSHAQPSEMMGAESSA